MSVPAVNEREGFRSEDGVDDDDGDDDFEFPSRTCGKRGKREKERIKDKQFSTRQFSAASFSLL